MKSIIATTCLVAFVLAEPPPSNSYLPPSPAGRSGGYPQGPQGAHNHGPQGQFGGPEVIAARNFKHGAATSGFARNAASSNHGGAQARFGGRGHDHDHHGQGQGYDQNASPFGRSGLDEVSGEPANYNFGYMVNDYEEGTDFGHHEQRQDERAEGEYHVVLPDGRKQTVSYEADERGFKPHISYEESDALGRSGEGYDSNSNNINARSGGHGSHGNHGSHGARANGY